MFLIVITSGGRHAPGEEESPADGRVDGCAGDRAVALDDGVDEEAGEQADVGGRRAVHVVAECRRHEHDAALDERAEEELERDVAPEDRVDKVVERLARVESSAQPVTNARRLTP